MYTNPSNDSDHLLPPKVWAFMAAEVDLFLPEEIHVLECDVCRDVLGACLTSITFLPVRRVKRERDEAAA